MATHIFYFIYYKLLYTKWSKENLYQLKINFKTYTNITQKLFQTFRFHVNIPVILTLAETMHIGYIDAKHDNYKHKYSKHIINFFVDIPLVVTLPKNKEDGTGKTQPF